MLRRSEQTLAAFLSTTLPANAESPSPPSGCYQSRAGESQRKAIRLADSLHCNTPDFALIWLLQGREILTYKAQAVRTVSLTAL
jgi:hypothetical protein